MKKFRGKKGLLGAFVTAGIGLTLLGYSMLRNSEPEIKKVENNVEISQECNGRFRCIDQVFDAFYAHRGLKGTEDQIKEAFVNGENIQFKYYNKEEWDIYDINVFDDKNGNGEYDFATDELLFRIEMANKELVIRGFGKFAGQYK